MLTTVQASILSGLSAGLTDEAIAGRLGISVRTCRRHVATLFQVLGATSRFQAGSWPRSSAGSRGACGTDQKVRPSDR
ncbi:helix-turn-helix transcriptional regulator [Oerskovia sp. M15]